MSEQEEILEIQRNIVAKAKAIQIVQQQKLKKDIREQIAKASGYDPKDALNDWEHKPYPTWVKLADGTSVIANNKTEHDALLGKKYVKPEAVSVDIQNLAQPEQVRVRRGRPPKAKAVELPKDLD